MKHGDSVSADGSPWNVKPQNVSCGFIEVYIIYTHIVFIRIRSPHPVHKSIILVLPSRLRFHNVSHLTTRFRNTEDISSFGVLTSAYALSKQWWKARISMV